MIAGLEDITNGQIAIGAHVVNDVAPKERDIAMVFQSYALYPHMTVEANMGFSLRLAKAPKGQIRQRVCDAAQILGLEPLLDRYPRNLSGGQRQRVALARALVIEPPVLLLDEPLSNLDANLREEMQFEIRRIQREVGITTLMVTHDQSEALSISDRVVVMQAGRITQIDAPYTLYEHPRTEFISGFVGKANLLPGERDGAGVVQVRSGGELTLSLRPEKIDLRDKGQGRLQGNIVSRFFLGSQWLYGVSTTLGELSVVRRNDGSAPLTEGTAVGLDWDATLLRVLSVDEVPA